MADGADGIELDVRQARDGVPVVIHDATLRRTGRCQGVIAKMSSDELAKINVGGWFTRAHPQDDEEDYSSEVVPTLDRVFRWFSRSRIPSATTNTLVYIELKIDDAGKSTVNFVSAVIQLINQHDFRDRVVVVSFSLRAIAEIKRIDASVRTGVLFRPERPLTNIVRKREMIAAAIDTGADEVLLHRLIVGPRAVRAAIEKKLKVVVWTVDDPTWMRRARRLGIHALITNNPAAFRQVCQNADSSG